VQGSTPCACIAELTRLYLQEEVMEKPEYCENCKHSKEKDNILYCIHPGADYEQETTDAGYCDYYEEAL